MNNLNISLLRSIGSSGPSTPEKLSESVSLQIHSKKVAFAHHSNSLLQNVIDRWAFNGIIDHHVSKTILYT